MSNRGKGFEKCLKDQLSEYPDVLVYRIPDQMSMVKGSCNPSDFIVYKRPHILFCEMKTIETPSLPAKCISDFQLSSMWEYSKIRGVKCFLIVCATAREAVVTMSTPLNVSFKYSIVEQTVLASFSESESFP